MSGIKRAIDKRRDAARRVTRLGELTGKAIGILCRCNRCGHSASLPLTGLIARLGPAMPAPDVATRLRCSICGTRDVVTSPDWPNLGQVPRHTLAPVPSKTS